jgi:DNA-binding transcriptional regulator YhcF (GntR family)
MRTRSVKKRIINIDSKLSQPIYKQIISSIQQAITEKKLQKGDVIPSVNAIAKEFSIARGSIFKAYNDLRATGIIDSIPGKGYFVTNVDIRSERSIFLLLSTFNPYREVLYNAFIQRINNKATVDVYFHHHNISVFETLIRNHAAYYNTFIIMPELHDQTEDILKQLDQKNLFILDAGRKEFGEKYPYVCQNYEKDIYDILQSQTKRLKKYKRIILLFSDNIRAYDVITGFQQFLKESNFQGMVVRDTMSHKHKKYDLCIAMDDNDLVRLIHAAKSNSWTIGTDIGVMSYNETPLKSVIADGITTITTDFEKMGITMADMVLNNDHKHIENPFILIDRKSF